MTAAQQLRVNTLGKSRSFVAGSAYCMGEFFFVLLAFPEGVSLDGIHCQIYLEVFS